MMKVYGYPNSRSTRITWMLEELEKEYEFCLVDFNKGESQSKEYLAINPAGKVPAFQDDDLLLLESAAIVAYLGDKSPESGLVPTAGTAERARYDQWSYFAMCELEQPLWTIGKNKFALPEDQRCESIFPTAQWEFQKALRLFSEGLGENSYILGDSFTAVDILLGQTLLWGTAFKQPIEQENLKEYLKRVTSRPALARASATEAASLEG
ncbi:glutathione S-transferase [Gammaproteobacteria bacterium 42_54_T18]|nr:glutathione S-transferase [Gammaproteobacteria bacterium 42_54_T18]